MENKELENMIRKLLSRTIPNDSIGMTVTTGDSEVERSGDPSHFVHYEVDTEQNIIPVEHDDPNMIPLTDQSIVASVWKSGNDECRVYRDRTEFEKEYR